MKLNHHWMAAAAASLVMVGCAGNTVTTDHKPDIRGFDAVFGPSSIKVQFDPNGTNDQSISLGQVTSYVTIDKIEQKISFLDEATEKVLVNGDQSYMRTGEHYTMVASRVGTNKYRAYAFADTQTNPTGGNSSYRIVNTLSDPDVLDIYLVAVGGSIDGVTPTVDNLAQTGASKYFTTTGGDYRLVIKESKSGNVFYDQTVSLPANRSVSLFILSQSTDLEQTAASVVQLADNAG